LADALKLLAIGVGLTFAGAGVYIFTRNEHEETDDRAMHFLNKVWRIRALLLAGFGVALACLGIVRVVAALLG
jgi:hypothetical protein